jgi:hypothetical protein
MVAVRGERGDTEVHTQNGMATIRTKIAVSITQRSSPHSRGVSVRGVTGHTRRKKWLKIKYWCLALAPSGRRVGARYRRADVTRYVTKSQLTGSNLSKHAHFLRNLARHLGRFSQLDAQDRIGLRNVTEDSFTDELAPRVQGIDPRPSVAERNANVHQELRQNNFADKLSPSRICPPEGQTQPGGTTQD